jgi:hypothetical protein
MEGYKRDPVSHAMIAPGVSKVGSTKSSFKGRKSMAKKKSIYQKNDASFITEAVQPEETYG